MAVVLLPYSYQVTKYSPADRDDHGRYRGAEDIDSDHGPKEAAYLATVAAFARENGIGSLTIREPALGVVNFGVSPFAEGHGLTGLFPPDLTGYHDGAQVSVAVAVELVRTMLRGEGAWCRLEVDERFFVHVGFDQYMYIGCTLRAEPAVALAGSAGLFVERITDSPVAMEGDDDVDGSRRPADAGWWAELASLVTERGAVLLEEGHVLNTSRWHRLTTATMDRTRVGLAPRSRLLVWSDLSRDIDTVLATLECDGLIEVVWQEADGELKSRLVDDETYADLPGLLGTARAAAVLSAHVDERRRCWPACSPTPMASCARVGRRSRATPAAGSCRRTMGMASCDAAPSTENPLKVHSGESRGKQSLAVGCG